jgi:hypothetical protein
VAVFICPRKSEYPARFGSFSVHLDWKRAFFGSCHKLYFVA